ncbi:MAG: FtsX-like permease family protein [Gemmatimonadetes bacterium]|nr:FtsX-like permease family protein [Gemmatimonadota bacterium]
MSGDSLVGRMDRLGIERLARSRGLPEALATRVADVVVNTGLPEDRRGEVFDELVAHFQDGLAAGHSPEALVARFGEAGIAARAIGRSERTVTAVEMGGNGPRDAWPRRVGRDVRYAIRRFAARPLFTAIAVASLGIGIGANTAMFTLVNDVVLAGQSVERPGELVDLYAETAEYPFNVFSTPDYFDFAREVRAFSGLAASKFSLVPYQIDGRVERLSVELVSGNYFEVLGVRPKVGRLFVAADGDRGTAAPVVALGERAWRRLFGGDESIVGRTIRLRGAPYTVIGVVPTSYGGRLRGMATDLYLPITLVNQLEPGSTDQLVDRNTQGTFVRGRLAPGTTIVQARVEVERVAADLSAQRVGQWEFGARPVLLPVSEVIVYPPLDRLLKPLGAMLLVVVALVLLVACANLASFLLARAVERRKEIAVRLALGATRGQLISQLLVETVLLALFGGAMGLYLGRAALQAVLASELPFPMPITLALAVDARVLAFSVGVSVAAGLVFGLLPALQSTRLDLATVIRDEATGGGRARWSLRNGLVGAQVAVSMVLMVVAGLLIRSLDQVRRVDPGFGRNPAGLVWIGLDDGSAEPGVTNRLRELAAAVPGVVRVGLGGNIHLNTLGDQSIAVTVDGVEPPPGEPFFLIDRSDVDSGFITAMGIGLRSGRLLTGADDDSVPRAALVNEAFAEKFWPGRDAVGRRFRNAGREVTVVGVVETAKVRTLAEEGRPFVYLANSRFRYGNVWLVAETRGDGAAVAAAVAKVVATDPRFFVLQARSLEAHIEVLSLPLRMGANALIGFAGLALVLAAIGLYGAVAYSVAQRSREIGIRVSLGADRGSVIRLLLWGGLRVALVGAAIGLPLAALAGRLFERVLFGVGAFDPVALAGAPVVVVAVAALAAYLPARRAGRLSPIAVLRGE